MDMQALLASEFHLIMPDHLPIYQVQHLAKVAEKRRNDRMKAAQEGKVFVG